MTIERPDLDALQAEADSATKGPWEAGTATCCPDMGWVTGPNGRVCGIDGLKKTHSIDARDAEFIASARTAVPNLIAYARHLEEQLESATRLSFNGYSAERKPYSTEWVIRKPNGKVKPAEAIYANGDTCDPLSRDEAIARARKLGAERKTLELSAPMTAVQWDEVNAGRTVAIRDPNGVERGDISVRPAEGRYDVTGRDEDDLQWMQRYWLREVELGMGQVGMTFTEDE